ncbi:MAG: tyrosine-protein phosphatase [bacterium]
MIDIHCHILPGMDDGAENLEESIQMCSLASRDGIKTIVATPHTMNGVYINNCQLIKKSVNNLNIVLNNNNIDVVIIPGAEVHVNYNLKELLNQGSAMTINDDNKYILLELPVYIVPPKIEEQIFQLKLEGITPIISHPERNMAIQNNLNLIYKMIKQGALMQLTALSLTGEFGTAAQKCAFAMLSLNYAHIIASDAHSGGMRAPRLSRGFEVASRIVGEDYACAMVTNFPHAIISGHILDMKIPEPKTPQKSFFQKLFSKLR